MLLSQRIAEMLEEMLEESGGELSIVRNELAGRLGCVPSQINYVITSRFTPERGYVVESRRGGGGYIRISRVQSSPAEKMLSAVRAVGDSLDVATAAAYVSNFYKSGIIDRRCARLILTAISDKALASIAPRDRDRVRSGIFKHLLVCLMNE